MLTKRLEKNILEEKYLLLIKPPFLMKKLLIIISAVFILSCTPQDIQKNECDFQLSNIHLEYLKDCSTICDSRLCCQYPHSLSLNKNQEKIFSYLIKNNFNHEIKVMFHIKDIRNNQTIQPGIKDKNGLTFCWNDNIISIFPNGTIPFGIKIIDKESTKDKFFYEFSLEKINETSVERYYTKDKQLKITILGSNLL